MSLISVSSPEVLTPDSHGTDPAQSQSQSPSHVQYSQSPFSSLPTPVSRSASGSSTGTRSNIDWSSFDQQKRRAEERWRKRRAIKAQAEQYESIEVSNSLPNRMTQLRMYEGSSETNMRMTSSSQYQLRTGSLDSVGEVSKSPNDLRRQTRTDGTDIDCTKHRRPDCPSSGSYSLLPHLSETNTRQEPCSKWVQCRHPCRCGRRRRCLSKTADGSSRTSPTGGEQGSIYGREYKPPGPTASELRNSIGNSSEHSTSSRHKRP